MRRSRPLVLAGMAGALTLLHAPVAVAAPGGGDAPADDDGLPPGVVVEDGTTQPVFSLDDAITERVYVTAPVDSDHDGEHDRVAIDIARPAETATEGLDVPVIFEHSPYRKDTWGEAPYPSVLVDELPQNRLFAKGATAGSFRTTAGFLGGDAVAGARAADLPGSLDDYYVPRGYAVVLGMSVGTGDSDGCPTSGDPAETLGTKAVIDWLNGRAPAVDDAGEAVEADWTTGDVGMIGGSYNGTLPNQVATTGVEGLKTIVPVAAISSWYDYYRANGLVVAPGGYQGEDADVLANFVGGEDRVTGDCADEIAEITAEQGRDTGDYTDFWAARDYRDASDVAASVFVVHGLNDWNVRTENFAGWWDELAAHDVPRKIWLHQGGHGGPGSGASVTLPDGETWTYKQTENRWFDHWLWGVDNGIMDEPQAVVQREDGENTPSSTWPDAGAKDVRLRLAADASDAPGALVTRGPHGPAARQSFVDQGRTVHPDTLVADPDTVSENRLVYTTPELDEDVRLSGRPSIRLRTAIENAADANLTVQLVDYGPAGSDVEPTVVTRGWTDPQNRKGADRSEPLVRGKAYDLSWTLEPKDYVVPAGHRIGLVVFSTDQEHTLLPLGGTELTVSPQQSVLRLPVVGGAKALGF
ncbi:Xaa-Pro dipeptidyl-peptidase [Isoptericola cucumis]|uniref:Xaa-Pro dipeptidyl-peptidase n=1 Tax=Isoptericola cucumis TaxID=1776856 RepID=UPI0032090266